MNLKSQCYDSELNFLLIVTSAFSTRETVEPLLCLSLYLYIYIYIIILFSILVLLFFTYLLINLTNQASINMSIFHITNIIAIYHKPLTHCIFTASIDIALHMTQEYLVEYVEMRLHMKIAQSNVIYVISGNILTA